MYQIKLKNHLIDSQMSYFTSKTFILKIECVFFVVYALFLNVYNYVRSATKQEI